tara:strand:- start:556 stop:885 length:330 start_codon:yes stop_codon:yes gene_type:complete
MTISYVWKIAELKIATSKDGLSNVVQSVVWALSAVDADFSVETVFDTFLSDPDPSKFVEFESLDETTVLSWVQQSLGQDLTESFKANLRVLLDEKKNSASKTVSPPWKK